MFRILRIIFIMLGPILQKEIMIRAQFSSTESSAEYLFNVMNQLQEHNRPSPVSADRTTGPGNDFNYFNNDGLQSNSNNQQFPKEILQTEKPAVYDYHRYTHDQKKKVLPDLSVIMNDDQQFAESVTPYYQVPAPQTILKPVQIVKEPAPLGLTRKDLAILYSKALQQGSPLSLSLVKNSFPHGQVPQIIGNQLRLNSGPPGYYYYFYPLKSFMNELQVNHAYNTIQHNIKPQHADLTAASSEKQVANPLFMAISGFIGMALIFMASVLFLPKIENFASRNSSNEYFQLSKVAWDAIEGRDCSERFACELNKLVVNYKFSKRTRRFLENVVPNNLRRQMIRLRKSTKNRPECRLITCKCD
ncbi:uncharacterized protein LOC107226840 [Neodiprion lecontei]|uniref:Uncharacterized protein LOC107226840 n=1 Tax=Neodiprion lecontei TaxID=441921 RepID=A0A6J0CAK9_NEOLC|nr:uncharacterized protein LOC107226840 [Neodiprion lecontei]